jgi:hypothetical protein
VFINVKPNPGPGEGIHTFESKVKALKILVCQPYTATENELVKVQEHAEKDTKKTRSLGETSQLELGDV